MITPSLFHIPKRQKGIPNTPPAETGIQSIAGHADVQMTLGRYSHKREEKVIEAGELIGRVFSAL